MCEIWKKIIMVSEFHEHDRFLLEFTVLFYAEILYRV
jgi:hypothetical protein